MDTPVRKYQKQKDYQRHKLFRKMKRRRKAAIEQAKDAPMKQLRRKLKIPKFEDGKDNKPNVFQLADGTFVNSHNEPLEVFDYAGVEDPTKWTYVDKKGNRYIPKATRTLTEGEQFTQRQIENEQNTRPFEFTPYIEGANEGAAAASLMMGFPFNMAGSAYYGARSLANAYFGDYLDAALDATGAIAPAGSGMWQATKTAANNIYNRLPWTYRIPENPNMAYRRMGPLERDWLMEGNELSTRETNALTEAEEEAAKLDPKYTTKSGFKFNFFKAGAEHGGRKQFAKGQPWRGTTVTHGEEQVLAIPGKGLPWVSGRHYKGPQGTGFKVRDVPFEEAPFGSHIDLLTEEGYTGVNPSLLDGSVIYSPYKIFGRNFGYKKLYPTNTSTPRGLLSNKPLATKGIPEITAENAASITPEQWTAAQDAAIAKALGITPEEVASLPKEQIDAAIAKSAEVQRLRDLHSKVHAPNTAQQGIMYNASGNSIFNEFTGGRTGLNWFSESKEYAANHGVPRAFYLNEPDIYFGNVPAWIKGTPASERYVESLKRLGYTDKQIAQKVQEINEAASSTAPAAKSVGMGANNELVTKNNNTAKLADAVTYDDKGARIPLGSRDNFNINDIRYGLLAPLAGGTALLGYNSLGQPTDTYKHGKDSGIHINPKNKGKFTALKKRTGKTTEQLTHSKN